MKKSWEAHALHILDAIARIRRIQARGNLAEDEILYDATLRNLQTMSEATQALPEELKSRFPQVPWRQISGFRNILVHNYLGNIDPIAVAHVVQLELDALEDSVRGMLQAPR